MSTLKELLGALLARHGILKAELAQRIGWSQGRVAMMLGDNRPPSRDLILEIAHALQLDTPTVDALLVAAGFSPSTATAGASSTHRPLTLEVSDEEDDASSAPEAAILVFLPGNPVSRDVAGVAERLSVSLGLTPSELGQMLKVSEQTVQSWMRGEGSVSLDTLQMLRAASASLDSLEQMFLPDRLPEVIRRPAEIFDGERAVDLVLRGAIGEVVTRYGNLLMYQA